MAVGVAVTLLESMISEVGGLVSVVMHITDTIKESVDFQWCEADWFVCSFPRT
jgi:hypothetical protein